MTNTTAANRYARALLDVAVTEKADLRQIEQQLVGFVDMINANPALEKVLTNPAVPVQRKRGAVAELTRRGGLQPMLSKLLALLADRDRLVLLRDLADAYRERLMDHLKIVRAEVTTAVPLAADRTKAIETSLAQLTGRTVVLSSRVDPTIIGGVVAKVGSTIYDGSVTRQLEKMKQRLVEGA